MGESDRYQEFKGVKKQRFTLGQDGNALMWLFIMNVVFLLVLLTVQAAYFFYEKTEAQYRVKWCNGSRCPEVLLNLVKGPGHY